MHIYISTVGFANAAHVYLHPSEWISPYDMVLIIHLWSHTLRYYGWKKYCAGKNIALLKEKCLKWLLSKRWPCCRFFDKNSPNSASFYPICTGFSRSISTERGLSFSIRGRGGSDQYFGSHFNLKLNMASSEAIVDKGIGTYLVWYERGHEFK